MFDNLQDTYYNDCFGKVKGTWILPNSEIKITITNLPLWVANRNDGTKTATIEVPGVCFFLCLVQLGVLYAEMCICAMHEISNDQSHFGVKIKTLAESHILLISELIALTTFE